MRQVSDVLHWLDAECAQLERLEGPATDVGQVRAVAIEALRRRYTFPLRVDVRAYVADVRYFPGEDGRPVRALEIIPEGFTPRVHRLLGGILVPCDRLLEAGSVVRVTVELADPGTYALHPPALLARLLDLAAEVAIEP